MTILYERLGLKPGATYSAVRAAYRAKAKEAHPDAGGDLEQFAELQEAHDVLTDPDRRKTYDSTGEITGGRVDLTDQMAMQVINSGLAKLLLDEQEHNTAFIIAGLRVAIEKAADEIGERLHKLERAEERAGRWAKAAKRTSGEGENRMKGMLEWHARQSSEMAEKVRRDHNVHQRAIQILDEHGFEGPPTLQARPYMSVPAGAGGSTFFGSGFFR
jgi:curved DNA-binding protein CbpA